MFCTRCGTVNLDAAKFCKGCGSPIDQAGASQAAAVAAAPSYAPPTPAYAPPAPVYAQSAPQFRYAGFWRRFVAMIIDGLVFSPVFLIFFAGSGLFSVLSGAAAGRDMEGVGAALFGLGIFAGFLVLVVGNWLYHTLMECSRHQATLGKMALGIKVTDMNGNRISFARANGRFFGKLLSGAVMNIGYIMAAFTVQKQALHDMLAGCLVVLK
jgi:uncharacterized RDD family membrane protein YckC